MKTLYTVLLFAIALLFIQCDKEDKFNSKEVQNTTNENISGHVYLDIQGDGTLDTPMIHTMVLYGDSLLLTDLYLNGESNGSQWSDAISTYTDENGYYQFNDLMPSTQNAIMLRETDYSYGTQIYNVKGQDNKPDGDGADGWIAEYIPVELLENEHDEGNDFIASVWQTSISGNVMIDLDGDQTTPELAPYTLAKIKLYNNNPFPTPAIDSVMVGDDGTYRFDFFTPGIRYRVELEVDNSIYVWEHGDSSPDPDGTEETGSNKIIFVDLSENENDTDNNFILSKNPSMDCNNMPYIEEYCPIGTICENNDWSLLVKSENGVIIGSSGGYQWNWTNYTTGETSQSNAFIVKDLDSIGLTITFPDGCEYNLSYMHDCDNICLDDPYILPFWDFCPSNEVCELDSWPIHVRDGDDKPLLLIDGNHFMWTNHTTGVTETSDAFYNVQKEDDISCTVTTSNGCEYEMNYLKICPPIEDFGGEWNLVSFFPNPWDPESLRNYAIGDVVWDFNLIDMTVNINKKDGVDFWVIPNGEYPYNLEVDQYITIISNIAGTLVTANVSDNKLTITDASSDGPTYEFER